MLDDFARRIHGDNIIPSLHIGETTVLEPCSSHHDRNTNSKLVKVRHRTLTVVSVTLITFITHNYLLPTGCTRYLQDNRRRSYFPKRSTTQIDRRLQTKSKRSKRCHSCTRTSLWRNGCITSIHYKCTLPGIY